VKNLKLSRPIPEKKIYNFIKDSINGDNLYNDLREDYCNNYSSWIQSTKVNNLEGLDSFKSIQYSYGTTESFDTFNLNNIKKRLRCFRGEYLYHILSRKRNFDWLYMEDDDIRENDAVIISAPFSDFGDIHPQTNDVLDRCDELGVPVFIDCAYMIIARDIEFDFNRKCIQGISFSMSKGFYGSELMQLGLRYSKEYIDDTLEIKNSSFSRNPVGMSVGLKIINTYDVDYTSDIYRHKQKQICNELNIVPSKCVTFGMADKNHPDFGRFDRGTDARRVCVSSLMGDMKDLIYKG
jgi:hypothetical protein